MSHKEIKQTIMSELGIGHNYAQLYMKKLKSVMFLNRRTISDFSAKYTNAGSDVAFTITSCGETIVQTMPVIRWADRKNV